MGNVIRSEAGLADAASEARLETARLTYQLACLKAELDHRTGRASSGDRASASRVAAALGRSKVTAFLALHAKQFYWTVTSLVGLGRLHDPGKHEPAHHDHFHFDARPQVDGGGGAGRPRLLVDISATSRATRVSGIQRVVIEIVGALHASGAGLPVIIHDGTLYDARRTIGTADRLAPRAGDRLLLLDANWSDLAGVMAAIDAVRASSGKVVACVYDLVPLLYPATCNGSTVEGFTRWFETVVPAADALVCISKATADDLLRRLAGEGRPCRDVGWFHLGCEPHGFGAGPVSEVMTRVGGSAPFLLSVGTVEPRKGHVTALDALDRLWARGCDVNYLIVGSMGWHMSFLDERIRTHPLFGRRLFLLSEASDGDLAHAYAGGRALVMPSIAEGFGLPVVEAFRAGLPVILSDIPVFREIAGDDGYYFDPCDPDSLADVIAQVMAVPKGENRVKADVASWADCAATLATMVLEDGYQVKGATRSGQSTR